MTPPASTIKDFETPSGETVVFVCFFFRKNNGLPAGDGWVTGPPP